jgi:hypothetical protein
MGWFNIPSAAEFSRDFKARVRARGKMCHCGVLADNMSVITGPNPGDIRNVFYCHECSSGVTEPCKKCNYLEPDEEKGTEK